MALEGNGIRVLVAEHGLSREQAYILSSVAVDLRISQVVDVPNYAVSTVCPLEHFKK